MFEKSFYVGKNILVSMIMMYVYFVLFGMNVKLHSLERILEIFVYFIARTCLVMIHCL